MPCAVDPVSPQPRQRGLRALQVNKMTDFEVHSTPDVYWRDKVQGPNGTLATAFITVFIVGASVATAASANVLEVLQVFFV